MSMTNNFVEKIESVRAAVFLLDESGKMLGQSTRWIVGVTKERPALESKGGTKFNFVIPTTEPLTTTNVTAQVNFTRVVLEGGKLVDANKNIIVTNAGKK